jgi:hypothetical protein
VEAPGFGDLVVRGVDGALQDLLYQLPWHRVLPDTPDAPARLYRFIYLQQSSLLILVRSRVLYSGSARQRCAD